MHITTIGLDLAKNVLQVHGVDANGKTVLQKQLKRAQVLTFFAPLPKCLVGMEACPGAHYWARELVKLGHTAKLMPAQYVKPYVKRNKTDANDAAGICEAVTRPTMRFVSVNTAAQQDMQMLHRIRSRLVSERTALTNQMRGLLGEAGFVFGGGSASLKRGVQTLLQKEESPLSALAQQLMQDSLTHWQRLNEQITAYDAEVARLAQDDPLSRRLLPIPGIGPLTATALVAAVNDAKQFANGRQLAANLGLTPYEHSSGGKQRLLGISKRGDRYVRTLLIHGARTALRHAGNKTDRLSRWALALAARRGKNVAAVGLANKMARITWAVLARERDFAPNWSNTALAQA